MAVAAVLTFLLEDFCTAVTYFTESWGILTLDRWEGA